MMNKLISGSIAAALACASTAALAHGQHGRGMLKDTDHDRMVSRAACRHHHENMERHGYFNNGYYNEDGRMQMYNDARSVSGRTKDGGMIQANSALTHQLNR